MRAPDGSRFVVAVFDRGELITEVFIDGPSADTEEDQALLLFAAADQYATTPNHPDTRRTS